MPAKPPRVHLLRTNQELSALGSAVRLDLIEQLKLAPGSSVRELATRLDRKPSSLYHHLAILEAAGLIRRAGERRIGKRDEVLYELAAERLRVARSAHRSGSRQTLASIGPALLRHAARAYVRAVEDGNTPLDGPLRGALLRLLSLRLDRAELRRLNRDLDQLVARWSQQPDQKAAREGAPAYRLVMVLAPVAPPFRSKRAKR